MDVVTNWCNLVTKFWVTRQKAIPFTLFHTWTISMWKLNGFCTHHWLMLSTVDKMHYLSQTGNKLIYILAKAHTKCKNIMTNEVITKWQGDEITMSDQ